MVKRKPTDNTADADNQAGREGKKESKPVRNASRIADAGGPKIQKFGRGKKYLEVGKLVDREKAYGLDEAIELILKTSTTKFDAAVELHARLGIDTKQSDQNIRSAFILPQGTGRPKRVLVFAEGEKADEAKKAGADHVGDDALIEKVNKGLSDFDIVVTTPAMMPRIAKLGKILGTKGMMPNPKSGTVTENVGKTVEELKAGSRIEVKNDKDGNVHLVVGRVSFEPEKIKANSMAVIKEINSLRPSSVKGVYLKSASLATTMGPSVKLDLANLK